MPEKENALKNTSGSAHSLFWHNIGMLTCWALFFEGHGSNLPADQEERLPGWLEDGPGEGQRSSAGSCQRVSQHAEWRFLCSQTERGEGGPVVVNVVSCCYDPFVSRSWYDGHKSQQARSAIWTILLRPAETWKLLNVLQGTFTWLWNDHSFTVMPLFDLLCSLVVRCRTKTKFPASYVQYRGTRDITFFLFHAFFLFFKTWCLQYPQCNLATEWHHKRQFVRLHAASSGAKNVLNLPFSYMQLCYPRPVNTH